LSPTITFPDFPANNNYENDSITVMKGSPANLVADVTDPNVADLQSGSTYAWTVTKDGVLYASGPGADIGSTVDSNGVFHLRNGFSFTPDEFGTYVATFALTDSDGSATASHTVDVFRASVVQVTNRPFVSGPSHLTPVGSALYFVADDGTNPSQLWRTDVRTGETVPVESGSQPISPDQTQLGAQVGSWFYFISQNTDGTYTLWRNDSSASPTDGSSPSEAVL
jgi:ELWxxDGT repeat protein